MPRQTQSVRSTRPTALIYCEGAEDLAFVRHVKKLYSSGSRSRTHFTATKGSGGAQDKIVSDASKYPGDFDRKLVIADKDRGKEEAAKAEAIASRKKIIIAWNVPCMEAVLLTILDKKSYLRHKSSTCKRLFEVTYIQRNKRTENSAYERIYTKDILEEARTRLPELEFLISFFTD